MIYSICTSNQEFLKAEIRLSGHRSDLLPLEYDPLIPDHQWQLCRDGQYIGRPHDITPSVGADIRGAIAKDKENPAPARARPMRMETTSAPAETCDEPEFAPPQTDTVQYRQPMLPLFAAEVSQVEGGPH